MIRSPAATMSYFTRSKRDASDITPAVPEPNKRMRIEKSAKKSEKERDIKRDAKKERKEREKKERKEKKAMREKEKEKERKEKKLKREKKEKDKERERREKKERKEKKAKEKEKSSSYSLFGEDSPLENINNFELLPSNHEKPYDLNHDLKFQRQLRLIQLSNAHLLNMAHPDFDSAPSFDESDFTLRDAEDDEEDEDDDDEYPIFDRSFDEMDLFPNFDTEGDMTTDLDSVCNLRSAPNERSSSPLSDIDSPSSCHDKFNIAIPIVDDVKTGISQVDNIIDQFKFLPCYTHTHSDSESSAVDNMPDQNNNSDNNTINSGNDTINSQLVTTESNTNSFLSSNNFNGRIELSGNNKPSNTPTHSLNLKLTPPTQTTQANGPNILLSPSSSFNMLNLSDRSPNSKKQQNLTSFSSNSPLLTNLNASSISNPPPIVLSEFLNLELPQQQSSNPSTLPASPTVPAVPAPATTKYSFEYRHNNRNINLALTKDSEVHRNCRQPYKRALNRLAIWSGKAQEMVLDRSLPMDEFII